MKRIICRMLCVQIAFCAVGSLCAQGTAFTYQGRLNSGGSPANGSYDLTFALFNDASGGAQVGATVTNSAATVSNGLFTTTIDFGPGVFIGTTNWLEIAVQTNASGGFTTLAPRQQVTPAPYAIYSANAGSAGSATTALAANNFSGALAGDVAGAQSATVVLSVGGQTAVKVAGGANAANAATNTDIVNKIVKRDASGNFSAGTITANLSGNATTATTATNLIGNVSDAQLSANIPLLNGTNSFTGTNNFAGMTTATNVNNVFNGTSTGNFSGNGGGLTNLSMAGIPQSMSTNRTFYNVMDWGADATGVIECSQAISNAMAAMPATGGTLYFHGRFWVANTIYITKPMTIYGDGSASITVNTNVYPSASEIDWSMNNNLFVVTATNVTFHGLTLNNTNPSPTAGAAIFVTNTLWYPRVNFDQLAIIGGWNGIDSEVNEHHVYYDCFFENMRNYAILARNNVNNDAGDWRVIGCTFANEFPGIAAIHIESSGGIGILGCKFNGNWSNQLEVIPAPGYTGNTSICQVDGNSFENYRSHAIYGSGGSWPFWTITGNEFAGYKSTTYPIYFSGGLGSHSIIDGNVFAYITGAAVYLSGMTDIHLGSMIIFPAGPARWFDGGGNSQIDDSAIAIKTGTISANNFTGNGAGLTNITAMTLSNASAQVQVNGNASFTGVAASNFNAASSFTLAGSTITNWPTGATNLPGYVVTNAGFADGKNFTNLPYAKSIFITSNLTLTAAVDLTGGTNYSLGGLTGGQLTGLLSFVPAQTLSNASTQVRADGSASFAGGNFAIDANGNATAASYSGIINGTNVQFQLLQTNIASGQWQTNNWGAPVQVMVNVTNTAPSTVALWIAGQSTNLCSGTNFDMTDFIPNGAAFVFTNISGNPTLTDQKVFVY